MRTALFFSIFFISAATFLTVQLYKTKDIPFLNDTVQGITSVLGIEPEIVKKKIEKEVLQYKQKEEAKSTATEIKQNQPEVEKPVEVPVVKSSEVFNSVETPKESEPEKVAAQEKTVAKEDDPFNSVETDEKKSNTAEESEEISKHVVKAVVHNTTVIVNDGSIQLRLTDKTLVNGKTFAKNYVLTAKTVLFNGRYLVITDALGVNCKSYEGDQEGTKIASKNMGKKGEIVLSEGEPITFIYTSKN